MSYIREKEAEYVDAKGVISNRLPFSGRLLYFLARTKDPKCNAESASSALSLAESTDGIPNILIFLSSAFNSLHQSEHDEIQLPSQTALSPNKSARYISLFLQNVSKRLVLSHHGVARNRFSSKRKGLGHWAAAGTKRVSHFCAKEVTPPKTINFTHASPT